MYTMVTAFQRYSVISVMRFNVLIILFLLIVAFCPAYGMAQAGEERISCPDNRERSWWDVREYRLTVNFDLDRRQLNGEVTIRAAVVGKSPGVLQIDLQEPMTLTGAALAGADKRPLSFSRINGHSYHIKGDFDAAGIGSFTLQLSFSGRPVEAVRAPWDGGVVYARDSAGRHWWAVACQGIGASVWFPCKDVSFDEPDSVTLSYTVPEYYTAVGNGMPDQQVFNEMERTTTFTWKVRNPVNLYNITFYIGDYARMKSSYKGIKGRLPITYYCLSGHERRARKQFRQVQPMLQCFEQKIGPYPFYADGFKIVEAPYLGMEHQGAIAYGNRYGNGYLGKDRSGSGVGLLFDFIIVHESGHEWFGNSITASDVAYSWIQEGFTSYTETILAECLFGKEQAYSYQRGKRAIILNDLPPEGTPGQCDGGSGDHYDKSAFMIHPLRTIMRNDERFFAMLRQMTDTFRHRIVDGKTIERFLLDWTGNVISPAFFDQYLRTAAIPVLCLEKSAAGYAAYWDNAIPGFRMPVLLYADGREVWVTVSTEPVPVRELHPDTEWIRLSEDILADIKFL